MPSSAPPDWSNTQEEILCPLCDYNLHGLSDPRCPECGYTFDWSDLIDPARRLHPYVFEHHPEKNVRSFWRTAAGALLPRRFWRTLQPVQPSRPRRLVLYWVLTVVVCYACLQVALASYIGWLAYDRILNAPSYRGAVLAGKVQVRSPDPQFGPIGAPITDPTLLRQYLDRYFATSLNMQGVKEMVRWYAEIWPATHVLLLPLVWPWLMFPSLMIFQWSMRRSKVRPIHSLRCTIYCGGTLAWVGVAGLAFFLAFLGQMQLWLTRSMYLVLPSVVFTVIGGLLLSMLYQLIVAYRFYMRFDHAVAAVLSALVIAALAPFTVYVLLVVVFPGWLPEIDW